MFPFSLPRLFSPMLAVCKLAHRMEYKSVNTSSRWRGGTVRKIPASYPHKTAFEVVRYKYSYLSYRLEPHLLNTKHNTTLLLHAFTHGLRVFTRSI